MAQLKHVVDPFGEVNIYPASGGKVRVVATILMEPHKEGAQTGIALDGSGSMSKLYGVEDGSRVLSPIFGGAKKLHNEITPIAQKLCAYLARKIDADGGTTCIYWAVGENGGAIEVVGDLRADEAERHVFGPPRDFGTGTRLLPAVRYFVERFREAPWGFYVFVTDGELHDLDEVKHYSIQLARDIAARRRHPVKFVLIGVGPSVNETQMEELDDLDSGTAVDLWDHKLAAEMRLLEEIFAEVVDRNARIADNGRILDARGGVVKDYSDTGLPGYLEFEMPASAEYFTLEVNGTRVNQVLSDRARAPVAGTDTIPDALPASAPPAAGAAKEEDEANAEWRSIDLEFEKNEEQAKGAFMAQLKKVVDPFGEVNIYPASGGKVRVVATILMEPHKEGAQTGIALDGSGSMSKLYGVEDGGGGGFFASLFGGKKQTHNEVTPVAQKICSYLARKIDADGGTTCIYWAVGPSGSRIEEVGDLHADEAERHIFGPPRDFGTGTQLLPAVKYFVERFREAPWGFYVFITDGELHDLDDVKRYSVQLARDIAARRRHPLKFVLIGIGPNVNEEQMEELDDLDTGTPIDLWDHKLAAEMRLLQEIFAEVVDRNARIADNGRILDPQGSVVKDYSDTGLSGYLEFEMPASAEYFTLDVNGSKIHQGLSDQAHVPPSQMAQ